MDFVTLSALAALASDAYGGGSINSRLRTDTKLNPDPNNNVWRFVTPAELGFSALSEALLFNANGYFSAGGDGQAFVAYNESTHQVVIAFRGTEPTHLGDIVSDLSIILGLLGPALAAFSPIVNATQRFVEALEAKGQSVQLLATGHSLGGTLAELLFAQNLAFDGGAGFGSPGLGPIPWLTSHSGSFVHVARTVDAIGVYAPAAHPGISIDIVDDFFSPTEFITGIGGLPHSDLRYADQAKRIAESPAALNLATSDGIVFLFLDGMRSNNLGGQVLANYAITFGGDGVDTLNGSGLNTALRIEGGKGNDTITGGNLSDWLSGGPDNDQIAGGAGDDHLSGGGGNDKIDGGAGNDIAVFAGKFTEYSLDRGSDGAWTVRHLGGLGVDGTDTLTNVESAQFGDRLVSMSAPQLSATQIYIVDREGQLYRINEATLVATKIGGPGVNLTDIAIAPDGRMYAISSTTLYQISPSTGEQTRIGSLGVSSASGFVIDPNGTAYLATSSYGGDGNFYRVNLTSGATTLVGTGAVSAGDLVFHNGSLYLSTDSEAIVRLNPTTGAVLSSRPDGVDNLYGLAEINGKTYGFAGTTIYQVNVETGAVTSLGTYSTSFMEQVNGAATADFGPLTTLNQSYANILRAAPSGTAVALMSSLASNVSSGTLSHADAVMQIVQLARATTSVATLTYEFFTGKIPSAAGVDYLVAPTGPNTNNLNSTYFQSFNLENRYINFAVNLGKFGDGAAQFSATYGSKTLFDATRAAYATIFGATPTDAKVHALIDTRVDYFSGYGHDGPNGIGTKAAMVGWLLAEAEKADVGMYAKANDAFLTDLADGATFAVDLVGVYGRSEFVYSG